MRNLLSAADLDRDEALAILDTAAAHARRPDPRGEEAAAAARPHRRQPVLRGLHPHPLVVRDRRQVAVGGRDQRQRQGLERQQGREPARHRAHRRGDGRRRAGRAAPRVRRGAAHRRAGSTATWSTPATARTSTRPRRCSTRTRCAAGSASSPTGTSPSSATSRTAGWRARTCCCCARSGARVTLVAPPTLMPAGRRVLAVRDELGPRRGAVRQGVRRRRRGDDAAGAARADERRLLPDRARVRDRLRALAGAARPARRGRCRCCIPGR